MNYRLTLFTTALAVSLLAYPAWAWVYDADPTEKMMIRFGYEYLYQPDHPDRVFRAIQTLQLDLEKTWPHVRLFVHNIGYHFGSPVVTGLLHDGKFWDDLRIGAQLQFHQFEVVYGGFRFWTKLPNTEDETGLGTDETDFWIVAIQSFYFSPAWAFHLNIGFGIIGCPYRLRAQNDFWAGGARLDIRLIERMPISLILHGFVGFKENDDKLAFRIITGYEAWTWLGFFAVFEGPLLGSRVDYADPLDHTAWGFKIYAEFTL